MPETFDADWLSLREPADRAARDRAAGQPGVSALIDHLAQRQRPKGPLRILDLGSGHGSNLRYLAPRLPTPQHWTLVDHDEALLTHARRTPPPAPPGQPPPTTVPLARDFSAPDTLAALFDQVQPELVTASALLDLVSAGWLEALVEHAVRHECACHFALTYAGAFELAPPHPDDGWIVDAINAHQRRDKGFGPALGPEAVPALAAVAQAHGVEVYRADTPWRLGPEQAALSATLVDGWAGAAAEQHPDAATRIHQWCHAHRGVQAITVAHEDVTGLPPGSLLSLRS